MAITVNSKIKDIMADPKAADIVEKFLPGFKTDKQTKMVYGMSLRGLQKFPQAKLSNETIEAIDKALAEIQ